MVRHYKRKTSDSYSHASLITAIEKVKNKEMSTRKAAAVFGVPRSTIIARINEKRGTKYEHRGRPTALTSSVEKHIANIIHVMERCGFGLTKGEVIGLVGQYVIRNSITTNFKDNIPGDDWFVKFCKRNKLSLKKPRAVEISRKKAADPFIVQHFYDLLEETILNINVPPSRIFNLDETSFNIDPSKSKILGIRGYSCTRTISTPGRENITVLLAANAIGEKIAPLIIFKGTYLWNTWLYQSEEKTAYYAATRKGWMESTVFESYFDNVIIPTLCAKNEPLLIIYDGHSTHLDINVLEKAAAHNITIIKLPPHTSHLLQPLDVSTMKSMKDRWEKHLVQWQRKNIGKKLPKSEFARIMTQIWSELDPIILVNGFRKSGIWPVDRNQITPETYDQLALERWVKETNQNEAGKNGKEIETHEVFNTNTEQASKMKNTTDKENKQNLNFNKEAEAATNYQTDEEISIPKEKAPYVVKNPKTFRLSIPQTSPKNISKHFTLSTKTVTVLENILLPTNNPTNTTHPLNPPIKPMEIKEQIKDSTTFEELVLQTISRGSQNTAAKKKRVGKGAEVITQTDAIERMKKEKNTKVTKLDEKKKGLTAASARRNIKQKSINNKENKKPKKRQRKNSESDTSNSDIEMSIHSDSDIFSTKSDDMLLPLTDLETSTTSIPLPDNSKPLKKTVKKENTRIVRTGKQCKKGDKKEFHNPGLNDILSPLVKPSDTSSCADTALPSCSKKDSDYKVEYSLNDTVLVRYVSRKVDYYVGVIVGKLKDDKYEIAFYSKSGKNDNTKFKKKKIQELGIVDSEMIVKPVDLLQITETEFVFLEDDDYCYFDY